MAFDFSIFNSGRERDGYGLDEPFVDWLVNEQSVDMILHYERLWGYYHNEMRDLGFSMIGPSSTQENESSRPYRQVQEYGLPSRITGVNHSFFGGILAGTEASGIQRKEVVIENDIAWRIDTIVDFLFGKPISITSKASDPERARQIQELLHRVFEANGGMTYFQQLGLLGGIYGFVDVILRWNEHFGEGGNAEDGKVGSSRADSAGN